MWAFNLSDVPADELDSALEDVTLQGDYTEATEEEQEIIARQAGTAKAAVKALAEELGSELPISVTANGRYAGDDWPDSITVAVSTAVPSEGV